ncbi:MAG TPA: glutamine amidotransferase, partial [Chthoniobacteraceae bacterium]
MKDFLATPVLPWPLLVLIILVIGGGIAWSLHRGLHSRDRALALGGFRIGALLFLLLILIQPQKRYDEVTILKPQLAVLVDTSESMTDPVDDAQPRRADRAKELLASPALAKARNSFDVRLFSFDTKVNELAANAADPQFQGGASNVVSAVNQVQDRFRGQPLAAILLLSDGLDTSGAARGATMNPGAPVYTFELEKEFKAKARSSRISVGNVDFPARVVVGWDSEIHAGIVGSEMSGKTTNVELWRDGKKQGESTISFNEDEQTRTVTFPVAPTEPGMIQYELRVNDPAADKDAKNYPFVIEALAPGKRILYIQNTLDFDFKFLRKAIVSDRNLQLNAFVHWGDGRLVSMGERGMPAASKLDLSANGLSKYSVAIIGDLPTDSLTAENYQALKDFVNRGGGLVLLGGPKQLASPEIAKTALAEVSPVKLPAPYREANVSVQITDAGLRHPVFGPLFTNIKDFPPLITANLSPGAANPTTEVLIEGKLGEQRFPLVAANRFGQGRVVAIMSDTIWRWRLAAKSWGAERSPYDTFWTQLMDWLIPKEQDKTGTNKIELFTERANYLLGEHPELRAIVR